MNENHDKSKPSVARLATKITPIALGLGMIEGLPAAEQSKRLAKAATSLIKLSQEVLA